MRKLLIILDVGISIVALMTFGGVAMFATEGKYAHIPGLFTLKALVTGGLAIFFAFLGGFRAGRKEISSGWFGIFK